MGSMMHALFANHDILVFPIIGLVLFASVFVTVVVRTFLQPRSLHDHNAQLPLESEHTTAEVKS